MSAKSEQRARSHQAILASAVRLLRRRGIAGTSVADVMGAAGLTVGGFYAHFASKDALVERSMGAALAELRAGLFRGLAGRPAREVLLRVVKRYLSRRHRDVVDEGCPLPALISEVASAREEGLRPGLQRELEAMVAGVQGLVPGEPARVRALALGCVALMVGALTLARATSGDFSDEILTAARALAAAALTEL